MLCNTLRTHQCSETSQSPTSAPCTHLKALCLLLALKTWQRGSDQHSTAVLT